MQLDLIVHNARIANPIVQTVVTGWLGVLDGRFVAVEEGAPPPEFTSRETVDADGLLVLPGMIDSHMHIESSLITPRRFAEAVVPFGTTTVLSDPHEVGNVAGEIGVRWMIAASAGLVLRIYHAIPSCVPSTTPELEWTAQVFESPVIERLATAPTVIALGELMDYRGLLDRDPRLIDVVGAAKEHNLLIEGHIPSLEGLELSAYLAHGVTSNHNLVNPAKIREQTAKGVAIMMQTESINPENMAAAMMLPDRSRIILVTDDIEPHILKHGHLSRIVQMAMDAGMPPLEAFAAATIRPARYLGLRDLGLVAPGYRADFMLLRDYSAFPPEQVYVGGQKVAEAGRFTAPEAPPPPPLPDYPSIPGPFTADDFKLSADSSVRKVVANAVTIETLGSIITLLEKVPVMLDEGFATLAEGDDLALIAVFARSGEQRAVGIIKSTGMLGGGFASSVAHDCHNLIVIGRDTRAMAAAANLVHTMNGGVAVAQSDNIIASLHLPFFGLLSDAPLAEVIDNFTRVDDALHMLGVPHPRAFLSFSLMALSVIPYFKFTDRGVVETEKRQLLPIWEAV